MLREFQAENLKPKINSPAKNKNKKGKKEWHRQ